MNQLLDRTVEEGVEYGFVFCYDDRRNICNRGAAIRGSMHRVPLTGCGDDSTGYVSGVAIGSFHTHPHKAAVPSHGDIEGHITSDLSFIVIGSANDPTGKRFRGYIINYDPPQTRDMITKRNASKKAIAQGEKCMREFYRENLEKTRSLWGDQEVMAFIEKFVGDDPTRTWLYSTYEWAVLAGVAVNVIETYPEIIEYHPDCERHIRFLKDVVGDLYLHVKENYEEMFEEIDLTSVC